MRRGKHPDHPVTGLARSTLARRVILNRRWEARYRGPDDRERSRRFATKREANQFLERVGVERQRGEWRDPKGGRIRLADWVEEWWPTTVNLKPSSRARDESYLRNHVLPAFGDAALGRITQLDVRAWVAGLDAKGLAPATCRRPTRRCRRYCGQQWMPG